MPYQGKFLPRAPEKYAGNVSNIIYRSSWERRFFDYCDRTPGILRWVSEEVIVPYRHPLDDNVHRYFPDVWLEAHTPTGRRTFLIEIKPKSQTEIRVIKRRTRKFLREASVVAINHAKWDAAKTYCSQRGWTFVVLTEDHLFGGIGGIH
jgi:hypothetical protein